MIFYIAHNYAAKFEPHGLKTFAQALNDSGHVCNSRWLFEEGHGGKGKSPEEQKKYAMEDFLDISNSEYLIHFCDQVGPTPGRGKFVEVGYALAVGKRVLIVGNDCDECVFYFMQNCRRFKTVEALGFFIEALPKYEEGRLR